MNPNQAFILQILNLYIIWRRNRRTVERREWVRHLYRNRAHGHGSSLIPEIRMHDSEMFQNFHRMTATQFDQLLQLVGGKIERRNTRMRAAIPASVRLAICLRFLATGSSYADLSFNFRMSRATICNIVRDTCIAIVEVLQPMYLSMPSTPAEWEAVAVGFQYRWNFPHCVGSIDGKHIAIRAPPASGSYFYNYKGFHSIVLMAACDAFYCFTFVDVGNFGRISDGGVFGNTYLAQKLNNDPNFLPPQSLLPSSTKVAPYVFVADEAFPLKPNLLRPFPGEHLDREKRVFNYRLSRARRCIENSFGILASRWRVLLTTMALSPEKATSVTLACCCLHNFLMKTQRAEARLYCPTSLADNVSGDGTVTQGLWRQERMLHSVQRQGSNRASDTANQIREIYKMYFDVEGAVSWQNTIL